MLFVQAGRELVIKNSDTVGHNSNIATTKNRPSNNLIPAGGQVTATFSSVKAIPAQVPCNINPRMKGWIVVRNNPYAAVFKTDGSFAIAAGETNLGEIGRNAKLFKSARRNRLDWCADGYGTLSRLRSQPTEGFRKSS